MKTGINLWRSVWQWFLRFDIKSTSHKEKTDKIQNICASKYIAKKMKYSPQKGKRYLKTMYLTKNLCLKYIKNINNNKWAKGLDRHFSKEDIQIANKHMKTCSTLSHQENANQSHKKIPLHIPEVKYVEKS